MSCRLQRGKGSVAAAGALLSLVLRVSLCAAAPADGDLRRLFPRVAALEAAEAGGTLLRLELPTDVLAVSRPDLSDLRLLDERGGQVPFVVDRGASQGGARSLLRRVPAEVLGAKHHAAASPNAPPLQDELYELRAPPAPPEGSAWQLLAETDAASFVRQLVLQLGTLARPGAELGSGSLFRLRDGHGERLRIPLPSVAGSRLLVRLTGQGRAALEPRWVFEAVEHAAPERVVRVPLPTREHVSEGESERFQLLRPPGIVPSALRIETGTAAFDRHVEVYARGQGSQRDPLGAGYVYRLLGAGPSAAAGADAAAAPRAEELELPLAAASGQWLDVTIRNGDSPALESLAFSAVIRTPSLVFALPASAGSVQLYFGGGRSSAPRYDLAHLLERSPAALGVAGAAERPARLAEARDNPAFDRTPALGFALRAGAAVDDRQYARQRALQIANAPDGLASLALDAADLAALRADLGDLRVVDAAGLQWPYLLELAGRLEPVPLSIGDAGGAKRPLVASSERASTQRTLSLRTLSLPVSALAPSALLLEPIDGYFDRPYHLSGATEQGERIELASGRLARAPGTSGPLEIALPVTRVRSLELEVEDGDNAPLGWKSARVRVSLPNLYVLAQPGAYRLLLGNPGESAPSYDIESARELVLSVASQEQKPGPLLDNPSFRASARRAAGSGTTNLALWSALVLAVAVLGGLTLRLARQSGPTR